MFAQLFQAWEPRYAPELLAAAYSGGPGARAALAEAAQREGGVPVRGGGPRGCVSYGFVTQ